MGGSKAGLNLDDTRFIIVWRKRIVRKKRQVLRLYLRDQHPVKGIMVRRSIFPSGEGVQCKDMLITHFDRQESGKLFPCEGNIIWVIRVFDGHIPNRQGTVIPGVVLIQDYFSRPFRQLSSPPCGEGRLAPAMTAAA